MRSRLGKVITKAVPLLLMLPLLIFPKAASSGAAQGLRLCGIMVSSLFPFMVLSAWAVRDGAFSGNGRICGFIAGTLFNLPSAGLVPIISGWLCGYPAGVRAAAMEYEAGGLTKREAERVLTFCACVSPQFAIAVVGVSFLGSAYAGACIYLGALASSVPVGVIGGLISRRGGKTALKRCRRVQGGGFYSAVADGTESMLKICGLTLIFSAYLGIFDSLGIANGYISGIIKTTVEVVNGCSVAAKLPGGFVICAFGLGFGGVSVICQCAALCRVDAPRLNLLPMVVSRLVHGVLTAVFAMLLLRLDKSAVSVFSSANVSKASPQVNNIPAAVVMLMTAVVIMLKGSQRLKIKKTA